MIFDKVFEYSQKVAIGGHIRPDGDCVGSCMGLFLYLKENYPNIQVDVYLEEIPVPFQFITDSNLIKHEVHNQEEYDLFIALDSGDEGRLGFTKELFQRTEKTICIDHHISNQGYAKENYIEPSASSTAELIFDLFDVDKITKEVAECLYLGIVHDTGVFQYSATSPKTMEVAAQLMRKGIDSAKIISETFYEKTYCQVRTLGYALLHSQLYLEDKVIVSVLNQETLEKLEVNPKDLEGIASQLRNTKGVETALFMYELKPGDFKVSLRSGNVVDVSKVAGRFGGGGHMKAAGVNRQGDGSVIVTEILEEIERQLNEK